MLLKVTEDGNISGYGVDPFGQFKVEGNHVNFNKFEFLKTMQIQNGWSIQYDGEFSQPGVMEGMYQVGGNIGPFKIWLV